MHFLALDVGSSFIKGAVLDAEKQTIEHGGLAQKLPLLRQFILEKLPGESRLCLSAEDTLLGLLVISQVISGRAKDPQEPSRLVSAVQAG